MIDLVVSNLEALSLGIEQYEQVLINDMVTAYSRQTNAFLGDTEATLAIDTQRMPQSQLLVAFERWLGWWLLEKSAGFEPTFSGHIVTMRLNANGRSYIYTLENTFNYIVVLYQDTAGGTVNTIVREDTASQNRWGRRDLIYQLKTPVPTSDASDIADDVIAQLAADPRPHLQDVAVGDDILEINVLGCGQLGTVASMSVGTAGFSDLDVMIGNTTNPIRRVERGRIETNTRQVHRVTEPMTALRRLEELMEVAGPGWHAGCYGAPLLDFYYTDKTMPYYKLLEMQSGGHRFEILNSGPIPPSMVMPGRYAVVEPTRVGLPSTMYIGDVSFDLEEGLTISGVLEDKLARLEYDVAQSLAEVGIE